MAQSSYRGELRNWLSMAVGSGVWLGLSGALFIAFLAHALVAPERLPEVSFVNPYALGLAATPPPQPPLLEEVAALKEVQVVRNAAEPWFIEAVWNPVRTWMEAQALVVNRVMLGLSALALGASFLARAGRRV
jgi:hypothetical protein